VTSYLPYIISVVFPKLCVYAEIALFSRILSLRDFGLYGLVIAIGKFCDYSSAHWFRVGFLRMYHPGCAQSIQEQTDLGSTYRATLYCCAAAVLLSLPIIFVLVREDRAGFALVVFLNLVGTATRQAVLNTLRGESRAIIYAVIEVVKPTLNIAAGLLLARTIAATFLPVSIGVFGSSALIGVSLFAATWIQRRKRRGLDCVGDIVKFAWPLVFSGLLTAALAPLSRYQLQWSIGPSAVALYAAAYAITRQPLDLIFTGLNLSMFTDLMKRSDAEGTENAAKLLRSQITTLLLAILPVAGLIFAFSQDIVRILFDARYWPGVPALVPIMLVSAILFGMKNYAFDQGFYAARKTSWQVLTFVPMVLVQVLGTGALVPVYGLSGAVYGECLAGLVGIVCSATLVRRVFRIYFPWRNVLFGLAPVLGMVVMVRLAGDSGFHASLGARALMGLLVYVVGSCGIYVMLVYAPPQARRAQIAGNLDEMICGRHPSQRDAQ
jgi:O-antigen/teichoic acid export membrane protein